MIRIEYEITMYKKIERKDEITKIVNNKKLTKMTQQIFFKEQIKHLEIKIKLLGENS